MVTSVSSDTPVSRRRRQLIQNPTFVSFILQLSTETDPQLTAEVLRNATQDETFPLAIATNSVSVKGREMGKMS